MNKLLLPGLRIKRWLLLFIIGLIFLIIAFAMAFGEYIKEMFIRFLRLNLGAYNAKVIAIIVLAAIGLFFLILSSKRIMKFLVNTFIPEKKGKIFHFLYKESQLKRGAKVVVLGGGTGLFTILRGLKKYTNNITAVVTMSDMGSRKSTSTGRLRTDLGMLPPGDVRQCMIALSDSAPLTARLFQYRFKKAKGLEGHSFGNLFLTALTKVTGSFEKGVAEASKILAIRGKVLPVTFDDVHLCARLKNGKTIKREHNVEQHKIKYDSEIANLYLEPEARANREVLKAIKEADAVVLGPGSLYTSILPNLLVKGITDTIKRSKAKKIYICNVMTQPGETDGYRASDHLEKIVKYLGLSVLDYIIINNKRAPERQYQKYRKKGSDRVRIDEGELENYDVTIIKKNLMMSTDLLRHDPDKLARSVLKIL